MNIKQQPTKEQIKVLKSQIANYKAAHAELDQTLEDLGWSHNYEFSDVVSEAYNAIHALTRKFGEEILEQDIS